MKKFFSLFAIIILACSSLTLTACGSAQPDSNVMKDWTEVSLISYNYNTTRSSHSSKVYFEYTIGSCTAQEYNSGDKLLTQDIGGTGFNFDIGVDEKTSFVSRAQQHVGKVYYYQIADTYQKVSITGFYSAIVKVKQYANHYIEITTVYHDYVGVTTEHQNKTIGVYTTDYTINYFN